MTNDEAITIIGNIPINKLTVDECYFPQYQEAKIMAIDALINQKSLEDIKAEMLNKIIEYRYDNKIITDGLLEIIDKYIGK